MARIADKHGLTNKYRELGSKRLVKRGRPRKHILGSSKKTKTVSKSFKPSANKTIHSKEITIKEARLGCAIPLITIGIIIVLLVSTNSCVNNNKKYVDSNSILQDNHPILYDEYDSTVEYYKNYENAVVGSYQSHKTIEKPVITALSYLEYDRIYLITINLNNLEQKYSFDEAIDIAFEYIPTDVILENFNFEKAIYKTKEDGKRQYECYYTQKKEGVEKPGYYLSGDTWIKLQNGFSLVIEETLDNGYIINIGDGWYEYVYNAWTIGWDDTIKQEKSTHITWDFSIEKRLSSK